MRDDMQCVRIRSGVLLATSQDVLGQLRFHQRELRLALDGERAHLRAESPADR